MSVKIKVVLFKQLILGFQGITSFQIHCIYPYTHHPNDLKNIKKSLKQKCDKYTMTIDHYLWLFTKAHTQCNCTQPESFSSLPENFAASYALSKNLMTRFEWRMCNAKTTLWTYALAFTDVELFIETVNLFSRTKLHLRAKNTSSALILNFTSAQDSLKSLARFKF